MRAFFDTNIAVYAFYDVNDPRSPAAHRLFAEHDAAREVVISTQVLLETYNVMVGKKRAEPKLAAKTVAMLCGYEVVMPSVRAAVDAAALAAAHKVSIWDAFIVQAAIEAGCETLFSEDLQAGRRFGALQVVNPFDLSAHEVRAGYSKPAAKAGRRAARGKARVT